MKGFNMRNFVIIYLLVFSLESCSFHIAAPVAVHNSFPFICFNAACRKNTFYYSHKRKKRSGKGKTESKKQGDPLPSF
jgi:hypothetical protein